ncbi:MAG: HlyD family efflux transporter periplasmic adaptor subunit [Verrucomicrobia bacterium]|jgi:HlyD family secretion protein|nr:HlyD family efflux transporter periplasmic adaptor subunit [Verrucomicrobiota bacterium]
MTLETSKPIGVPAWKRWLEFRHRVLPFIIFVLALLAVITLWDKHLTSPSLIGQVETTRLDIRTPSSGTITNLLVTLFQNVQKGDTIAKLDPGDPLTALGSQADLLLAKKELLQLMNLTTAASAFDIQRNVLDKERLRTELMQQKVALASAEVQLENLKNEWNRAKDLHAQELLSDSQYDLAEKTYTGAQAAVNERKNLIIDLGKTIQTIEQLITSSQEIEEAKLDIDRTTLQRSIAKLEQDWIIRAPTDGTVTAIQKRQGEMVGSSDSIITLTESKSDTVITYLPQGSEIPVKIGQKVNIKTRTQLVRECQATIVRIGTSYELMPDMLSQLQLYKLGGIGVPLIMQLPPDFECLPGEMVNITLNIPGMEFDEKNLAGR